MELALNIEKQNATQVMLRNISFAFLLLSLVETYKILTVNLSYLSIALIITSFTFAIIAAKQAKMFQRWFYLMIYEITSAGSMKLTDLLKLERQ